MIVKVHNWNKLRERGYAADVIAMPVCYDTMIDLLKVSNLQGHMRNATGIAVAGETCIYQ